MVLQQQTAIEPARRQMAQSSIRGRSPEWTNDLRGEDHFQSSKSLITRELDQSDMVRLVSGDREAMTCLMRRHSKRLRRYLAGIVKGSPDVTDLVQESSIRVFQHRADFNNKASFSTWLYTIAYHLAIDLLRRRSRRPMHVSLSDCNGGMLHGAAEELNDGSLTPSEQLEADEQASVLEAALAGLPDKLRLPLTLVVFENFSQAEIAARLRCSPKAVEMRIYHARGRLRAELQRISSSGPFASAASCLQTAHCGQ